MEVDVDRDHRLPFPVLRGGIRILNPANGHPGTLGLICTANGTDRWILSCYHVLCRLEGAPFTPGEPIYQPTEDPANLVARLVAGMADPVRDFAAALIEPGRPAAADIIGMPFLGTPEDPVAGMEVLKSGMMSGVTTGVITSVSGDVVRVEPAEGFPEEYSLSQPGDSGAIWVSRRTCAPVAMNFAGEDTGAAFARGIAIRTVLASLNLAAVLGRAA